MKYSFNLFFFSLILICSFPATHYASNFDPGNWHFSPATGRHILDVQVLTFNTIIVVGGNESNDAITSVLRTDDRGQNWTVIMDVPFSPWLQAVHFPTSTTGFAAGYDGMVLRTTDSGNSWDTLDLPGNAALRDYNDVYFISATTGFLVGGNQSNDSIQTILKTTDGGNNWQIMRDDLGYWLNSVQFISTAVGFACGEHGTILKTTDGGDTWVGISPQGNLANRHYNDIRFTNELNGFAVGGTEKNDSIRTIIHTQDGGISWLPMLDNVDSWLNAIEILPSGDMIVVGNDSTTLLSSDGGVTWNNMLIPASVNYPVHLNSVDFLNADFGVIVGNYGQILLYEAQIPTIPTVVVNAPVITSSDSVWISGNVWANSSNAVIHFDYGPTPSLGFTMDAYPSMIAASDSAYVEALLTDIGSGIYYYQLRAENLEGTSFSDIRQLYIGDLYESVNLDFEYWDEVAVTALSGWRFQGRVSQAAPYSGLFSATVDGWGNDSFGAMVYGDLNNDDYSGGFPVSAVPDSIVGYFNYALEAGTEGMVLIALRKNGLTIYEEYMTYSGSSNGVFERLSFPIGYLGIEVPDTMVVGLANNNPFSGPVGPSNFVTIDDLSITPSGSGTIPNSNFEDWEYVEIARPLGWYSKDFKNVFGVNRTSFQTTDAQHGHYALVLRNDLYYNDMGEIRTDTVGHYNSPSFPVAGRHVSLNGYYKFDMQGVQDTALITVSLFKNGDVVGAGQLRIAASASTYTPFEIEFVYPSSSVIPDSANIDFRMGLDPQIGPSVLTIDNLSFDGFVVPYQPLITTIKEAPAAPSAYMVYPNPTDGMVWISSTSDGPISKVAVYSLSGALVHQAVFNSDRVSIDMKDHPAGIYLLQVFSADGAHVQTKKLIRY